MGFLRSFSLVGVVAAVFFALLPKIFDFDQCTRACTVKFGGLNNYRTKQSNRQITGYWTLADRFSQTQRCYCEDTVDGKVSFLGDIPRLNPEEEHGYPYVWRDPSVCGEDGKVHSSASAARNSGVKPLHCGPHCGDCSTVHDIKRYRDIGENVSKVVGPCILSYFLGGSLVDKFCMNKRAEFTPACTDCWIEDHGCLAAHCFYDCVFKGKQHWNRLLGINPANDKTDSTESCVLCMEKYCSAPFIRTCGVNRRSAGVKTDLNRDAREICKL